MGVILSQESIDIFVCWQKSEVDTFDTPNIGQFIYSFKSVTNSDP